MQDNAQGYLAVRGPYAIVPDTAGKTDLTPANDPLANGWFAGNVTAAAFLLIGGGGLMTNPMTTAGDIIYGLALGVPARLGIGFNQQVLTLVAGVPAWVNATPMTALGDMITGLAGGVPTNLPIGTTGQVLTVAAGVPSWQPATVMTAVGDMIRGGVAGLATVLPIGATNQVLQVVGGIPAWTTLSAAGQIALSVKNDQGPVSNSVVPVDITNLVANVLAGVTYSFRAVLMTVNTAAAGAFFQLNGTATFTVLRYWVRALVSVANVWVNQPNVNAFANGIGVTGANIVGYIEGTITVNVAGTVQPQFSNDVSAGNTLLKAGSFFILTPIP